MADHHAVLESSHFSRRSEGCDLEAIALRGSGGGHRGGLRRIHPRRDPEPSGLRPGPGAPERGAHGDRTVHSCRHSGADTRLGGGELLHARELPARLARRGVRVARDDAGGDVDVAASRTDGACLGGPGRGERAHRACISARHARERRVLHGAAGSASTYARQWLAMYLFGFVAVLVGQAIAVYGLGLPLGRPAQEGRRRHNSAGSEEERRECGMRARMLPPPLRPARHGPRLALGRASRSSRSTRRIAASAGAACAIVPPGRSAWSTARPRSSTRSAFSAACASPSARHAGTSYATTSRRCESSSRADDLSSQCLRRSSLPPCIR